MPWLWWQGLSVAVTPRARETFFLAGKSAWMAARKIPKRAELLTAAQFALRIATKNDYRLDKHKDSKSQMLLRCGISTARFLPHKFPETNERKARYMEAVTAQAGILEMVV